MANGFSKIKVKGDHRMTAMQQAYTVWLLAQKQVRKQQENGTVENSQVVPQKVKQNYCMTQQFLS